MPDLIVRKLTPHLDRVRQFQRITATNRDELLREHRAMQVILEAAVSRDDINPDWKAKWLPKMMASNRHTIEMLETQ